jgi:hypothetical protein
MMGVGACIIIIINHLLNILPPFFLEINGNSDTKIAGRKSKTVNGRNGVLKPRHCTYNGGAPERFSKRAHSLMAAESPKAASDEDGVLGTAAQL